MASATFDLVTAAVTVEVLTADWPGATPVQVSIVRRPSGEPEMAVRGWTRRAVVAGHVYATDGEMPLESPVTYTVAGFSSAGASVGAVTVTVDTSGAEHGLWIKAPGRPDLTVRVDVATFDDIGSDTIGGNYQILGGDALAVSQWGGLAPDRVPLTLRTDRGPHTAALRALLTAARIVLLQPIGLSDIDPGWYFAASAGRSNPGGFDAFEMRYTKLQLETTAVPAGDVAGAVWTWDMLAATYATWDDVAAAYSSWAGVMRGPA